MDNICSTRYLYGVLTATDMNVLLSDARIGAFMPVSLKCYNEAFDYPAFLRDSGSGVAEYFHCVKWGRITYIWGTILPPT
jgi:hypothetical protein